MKTRENLTSLSADVLPLVCFNNNKRDERASSSLAPLSERRKSWELKRNKGERGVREGKEGGGGGTENYFFGPLDIPKNKFVYTSFPRHTT
jgi:hypothetical protein